MVSDVARASLPRVRLNFQGESADAFVLVPRVIALLRTLVVIVVLSLLYMGPMWMRQHVFGASVTLIFALLYALLLLQKPHLEIRRTRYAWLVTATDATVTLLAIGFTGGASSPFAMVLMMVVVAAAARSRPVAALAQTAIFASSYSVLALATAGDRHHGHLDPVIQALLWPLFLVFTATMAVALSVVAEREMLSRLRAGIEAEAEHAAADEERDLRARLLQSYESQQDGLRVLLHEFRTPFASLEALGQALVDASTPMSESDRAVSLRLANAHIRHVNDMLDALGDVALSWRPTFSSGAVRGTNIEELVLAAADAVGLHKPRLTVTIVGDGSSVQVDEQGLRRVLTNLLENAARHGHDKPIHVLCSVQPKELCFSVMDRGPGVSPESLGELTAKFVSLGDQRGTAGLGLWIVQQILEATGGRLHFTARPGGGLTATFHMPLAAAAG